MALGNPHLLAAIAVTRFGLGAKPGELAAASSDPQGFLRSQIRRSGADKPPGEPASTAQRLAEFRDYRKERREVRAEKTADTRAAPPSASNDPSMAESAPG